MPPAETVISFNVGAWPLLITLVAFFVSLLGVVWKGKKEIGDTIKEEMEPFKKSTEMFTHNIKVISDFLSKHHTKFNSTELRASSPLQLTKEGNKLIEDIGFDNIFEKNKANFFDVINGENPKLKYDVELSSIKSIYALKDNPYMDFLKVFFYNNPDRTLENTAPTLGIYIRDMYLMEHPEITQ